MLPPNWLIFQSTFWEVIVKFTSNAKSKETRYSEKQFYDDYFTEIFYPISLRKLLFFKNE